MDLPFTRAFIKKAKTTAVVTLCAVGLFCGSVDADEINSIKKNFATELKARHKNPMEDFNNQTYENYLIPENLNVEYERKFTATEIFKIDTNFTPEEKTEIIAGIETTMIRLPNMAKDIEDFVKKNNQEKPDGRIGIYKNLPEKPKIFPKILTTSYLPDSGLYPEHINDKCSSNDIGLVNINTKEKSYIYTGGVLGDAYNDDNYKEFSIERSISHEMFHVGQDIRGENFPENSVVEAVNFTRLDEPQRFDYHTGGNIKKGTKEWEKYKESTAFYLKHEITEIPLKEVFKYYNNSQLIGVLKENNLSVDKIREEKNYDVPVKVRKTQLERMKTIKKAEELFGKDKGYIQNADAEFVYVPFSNLLKYGTDEQIKQECEDNNVSKINGDTLNVRYCINSKETYEIKADEYKIKMPTTDYQNIKKGYKERKNNKTIVPDEIVAKMKNISGGTKVNSISDANCNAEQPQKQSGITR